MIVDVLIYLVGALAFLTAGTAIATGRPTTARPKWQPYWPAVLPTAAVGLALLSVLGWLVVPTATLRAFAATFAVAVVGAVFLYNRNRRGWWFGMPFGVMILGVILLLIVLAIATYFDPVHD